MEQEKPKRPVTAFFLFKDKLKAEGKNFAAKEAGIQWKALSEEEKQPFIEQYRQAKAAYDKYLEEVLTPCYYEV